MPSSSSTKAPAAVSFTTLRVSLMPIGYFTENLVPGIILDLLESERDLAGLEVVVEDHALDFIGDFKHLVRLADLAHPGELGDVSEALDPLLDLDEGTVVGELGDRAMHDIADMIALLEGRPGIGGKVLEGEVDAPPPRAPCG